MDNIHFEAIKIQKVEMGATKVWKVKYYYEKQLEELMKFISSSSMVSLGTQRPWYCQRAAKADLMSK